MNRIRERATALTLLELLPSYFRYGSGAEKDRNREGLHLKCIKAFQKKPKKKNPFRSAQTRVEMRAGAGGRVVKWRSEADVTGRGPHHFAPLKESVFSSPGKFPTLLGEECERVSR